MAIRTHVPSRFALEGRAALNGQSVKRAKPKKASKFHRTTLSLFKDGVMSPLNTDLYSATMAQAWWEYGLHRTRTTFAATFRRLPANRGYAIAGGTDYLAEWLKDWRFTRDDIDYMATLRGYENKKIFKPRFLEDLYRARMTSDIDTVREGTLVYPHEPIVRADGEVWINEFLEGGMLNMVCNQSATMTQVAGLIVACDGDSLADNSFRRGLGMAGHLDAIIAAYKAGVSRTSNVAAGRLFGIPVSGTMAHCWVMFFEKQREAFLKFALACPANAVFLVDTYGTMLGIEDAIWVARELKKRGRKLYGIRLDSGDLADLSRKARKMFDKAGFRDVKVIASNSLDELKIESIRQQGGKVVMWASGDAIADAPLFGLVWKIGQVQLPGGTIRDVLKLSDQGVKVSIPGGYRFRRYFDRHDRPLGDVIYEDGDDGMSQRFIAPTDMAHGFVLPKSARTEEMLLPLARKQLIVRQTESLDEVRDYVSGQLRKLPVGQRRFLNPHSYSVGLTEKLAAKRQKLFEAGRALANHG